MTFSSDLDSVFAPAGVLEQAMAGLGRSAQYRSSQEEFARHYGEFLTSVITDPCYRGEFDPTRPPLYLGDIAAGMGKTIVIALLAALKYRHYGVRTILATFTRQLREEYLSEQPLVDEVMRLLGYDAVKMMPYVSLGSACSLDGARFLEANNNDPNLKVFREFVEESYQRKEVPLFADFVTKNGQVADVFWSLPNAPATEFGVADMLTIRHSELKKISKRIRDAKKNGVDLTDNVEITIDAMRRQNDEAKSSAPILLTTHAMLTINTVQFGVVLNTNKIDISQSRDKTRIVAATNDRFDVVVDEAHLYYQQALNSFDQRINLDNLLKEVKALRGNVRSIMAVIDFVRSRATDVYGFQSRSETLDLMYLIETAKASGRLPDPSSSVIDAVKDAMKNADAIGIEYLTRVLFILRQMISWSSDTGKGRGAATPSDAGTMLYGVVSNGEVSLKLQATTGRTVANRLWRNVNVHGFDHIAFLSGTLSGRQRGDIKSFCSLAGLIDPDTKDKLKLDAIYRPQSGTGPSLTIDADKRTVRKVVYPNHFLRPRLQDGALNTAYWDYVADTIIRLEEEVPRKNTLVLFSSYDAEEYVKSKLVGSTVIFQSRSGAHAVIDQIKQDHAFGKPIIACCLNWQGVNFVSGKGKTIFDRVVLTTIPNPVPRHNDDFYHTHYADTASQMMRQGINRIFRRDGDSGDVWFLTAGSQKLPLECVENWHPDMNFVQTRASSTFSNGLFRGSMAKGQPVVEFIDETGAVSSAI